MNNEKEKKGFKKYLLLILVAVPILVAFGVVAGNYFTHDTAQVVNGNEAETAEAVEEVTVPLEEFVLNLEPTSNINRYIRLELSLSSIQKDGEEVIHSNLDKIRDIIIQAVSRQSVEDVFDEERGINTLKAALKEVVNNAFAEEIIYEVYITNIVIQ